MGLRDFSPNFEMEDPTLPSDTRYDESSDYTDVDPASVPAGASHIVAWRYPRGRKVAFPETPWDRARKTHKIPSSEELQEYRWWRARNAAMDRGFRIYKRNFVSTSHGPMFSDHSAQLDLTCA